MGPLGPMGPIGPTEALTDREHYRFSGPRRFLERNLTKGRRVPSIDAHGVSPCSGAPCNIAPHEPNKPSNPNTPMKLKHLLTALFAATFVVAPVMAAEDETPLD